MGLESQLKRPANVVALLHCFEQLHTAAWLGRRCWPSVIGLSPYVTLSLTVSSTLSTTSGMTCTHMLQYAFWDQQGSVSCGRDHPGGMTCTDMSQYAFWDQQGPHETLPCHCHRQQRCLCSTCQEVLLVQDKLVAAQRGMVGLCYALTCTDMQTGRTFASARRTHASLIRSG